MRSKQTIKPRYEKIFSAISKARPYWEKLADVSKNCYRSGCILYQSANPHLKPLSSKDNAFSWAEPPTEEDVNLLRLGIPLSFDARSSNCYILQSSAVDSMTDSEIEFLLTKPVVADGEAVEKIINRGFGHYFPFKLVNIVDDNAFEYFTNDSVNPREGTIFRENPYSSKMILST